MAGALQHHARPPAAAVRPDRYIAGICESSQSEALAERFARRIDAGQDAVASPTPATAMADHTVLRTE
ncbi:hypothetical protein ACU4GD_33865 [Cupriavidus basilensis]